MNSNDSRNFIPLNYRPTLDASEAGCSRAGTKIVLSDGSEKKIEDLVCCTPTQPLGGDSLLSVDGSFAYVVALSGGPQPKAWQMLEVTASSVGSPGSPSINHSIVVTRTHSFARAQTNIVQAHFLRPGDLVQSIYGDSIIDSVTLVEYANEDVWNIYLASHSFVTERLPKLASPPERLNSLLQNSLRGSWLGLAPREHLVLCNGFLTGDLSLQIQLEGIQLKGTDYSSFY